LILTTSATLGEPRRKCGRPPKKKRAAEAALSPVPELGAGPACAALAPFFGALWASGAKTRRSGGLARRGRQLLVLLGLDARLQSDADVVHLLVDLGLLDAELADALTEQGERHRLLPLLLAPGQIGTIQRVGGYAGFVSRLDPFLVEAFGIVVRREHPRRCLVVVGEPRLGDRERFRHRGRRLGQRRHRRRRRGVPVIEA